MLNAKDVLKYFSAVEWGITKKKHSLQELTENG